MTAPMPQLVHYLLGPGSTWRDVGSAALDVAVVGWVLYRVLLLIRGTRAVQVLVGLFLMGLAYVASEWANLVTLSWLLGHFLTYSFIFGVIVIFQSDIRRGLARLGRGTLLTPLFPDERRAQAGAIEVVTRAAVDLARRRRGALMAIERVADLTEVVESGVKLDAELSHELLLALFHPGGTLHDGAVVLSRGRVVAASCLFPLTTTAQSRELGTRHRAAVGLAEEVDAVVVVVSEERGEISVAVDGTLKRGLDEDELRALLAALLVPARRKDRAHRDRAAWEAQPPPQPRAPPADEPSGQREALAGPADAEPPRGGDRAAP